MVSYYRPIVTLCLKCTVFEIWRHIGRKSLKKPNPPSFGTFLWGDPLRIFRRLISCQKLEWWGYQMVYISRSCFRSARHNTGVWQTDVRTDRRTRRCRKDPRYSVARVKRNPLFYRHPLFLGMESDCHRCIYYTMMNKKVNMLMFFCISVIEKIAYMH